MCIYVQYKGMKHRSLEGPEGPKEVVWCPYWVDSDQDSTHGNTYDPENAHDPSYASLALRAITWLGPDLKGLDYHAILLHNDVIDLAQPKHLRGDNTIGALLYHQLWNGVICAQTMTHRPEHTDHYLLDLLIEPHMYKQ
jgi:hypothetical protein